MVGPPSFLHHQPFQIGVELLCGGLFHLRGEHRLGMARGEPAAGFGRPSLHEHRAALRPARQVQRPLHLVERAFMVHHPDPVGVGIGPALPVIQHRVVGPTVPQSGNHAHVLLGAFVPFGMRQRPLAAIVLRCRRQPSGDDVPSDPPVRHVIDRGELPSEVERFGVSGGTCGDQANSACGTRQRGERGYRFQPGARRVGHVLPHPQRVSQEHRVEQARLGDLGAFGIVTDIRQRQFRRIRVPPCSLMMTAAMDEKVQMQPRAHDAAMRRWTGVQAMFASLLTFGRSPSIAFPPEP